LGNTAPVWGAGTSFNGGKGRRRENSDMSDHRLFRGQSKKYNKCLLVPSALRGCWPGQYPLSNIECCNDCMNILKVERFLNDLKFKVNAYKKECEKIVKKEPFENCTDDIPYIFWLSIVFCDIKIANMGKNTSFSGTGFIPYPIGRGSATKVDGAETIEEYAKKIVRYYFEHNPPGKNDDFIRKYMVHQHYCKDSYDYEKWKKEYLLKDGSTVDGNELPDHFTLLLDWTESQCEAEKFAGEGGTIVSIDSDKYADHVGADYRMSYDDEIIKQYLIDTAERQKAIVTFWPWTFTIDELENNELGRSLGFRVDTRG
jgi:hypothetical protein